jgi:hypothetical protein
MTLYGICDLDTNDFVRELPSKVDDGGEAILVFTSKAAAERRGRQHFGCENESKAVRDGLYRVCQLGIGGAKIV